MSKQRKKPDIDLAISVAGEDSAIGRKLSDALKEKGVSTFFYRDPEWEVYLIGKDRDSALERIFADRAKLVVPVTSEHYRIKNGCKFELEVALIEAKKRPYDYIFQARLDSTPIYGLSGGIHRGLKEENLEEIAELIINKLVDIEAEFYKPYDEPTSVDTQPLKVLTASERKVVGLVATSLIPLNVSKFEELAPEIDWAKEVKKLSRAGFLETQAKEITVRPQVAKALLSDEDEERSYHETWTRLLEPIWYSTDIGVLLSFHLFHLDRFNEAVKVLVDIASPLEPGYTNELYLNLLKAIKKGKFFRRLDNSIRIEFYNSLGLCLARAREYEDSIKTFDYLRRISKKANNKWGIGQSYLNTGVVYYRLGNYDKAASYYEKTEEFARAHKDDLLLSRALNNRAVLLIGHDNDLATKLIEESVSLKEKVDDVQGIAGGFLDLGIISALKGDLKEAKRVFPKAVKIATKYDLLYVKSLALSNLGNVFLELGDEKNAFSSYAESRSIAEEEGFLDALLHSLKGEASLSYDVGRFKEAERLSLEAELLCRELKDDECRIQSLINAGAARLEQHKPSEARRFFSKALGIARRTGNDEGIYVCRFNTAMSYGKYVKDNELRKRLSAFAKKEEKAGYYLPAGLLYRAYADYLVMADTDRDDISVAYERSITNLRKVTGAGTELLQSYKHYYIWNYDREDIALASLILDEVIKIAEENNQVIDLMIALDEKGVCLQKMGQTGSAEDYHLKALALAREFENLPQILNSLNNLGELYRKVGRLERAIELFKEGESLARKNREYTVEISIKHGEALAWEDLGEYENAERLLRQCRNRARANGLNYEYVRALAGLANLSLTVGDKKLARRRYKKALNEAVTRNIEDLEPSIRLNFAMLLKDVNEQDEALKVVEPVIEVLSKREYGGRLYALLGEIYYLGNKVQDAIEHFETALEHGLSMNEREMITYSAAWLADIYESEADYQTADEKLALAYEYETDVENRAFILKQRTDLALKSGDEESASKYFKEAYTIVTEQGFIELAIDLNMLMGDYYWQRDKRSQYKALQFYLNALATSPEADEGLQIFLEVGLHISKNLIVLGGAVGSERIIYLKGKIEDWIAKQIKDDILLSSFLKYFFWPFGSAIRIIKITPNGCEPTEEDVIDVTKEVLNGLLN